MARTIAVIGALDEEVALIAQSLRDTDTTHAAGLDIVSGSYAAKSGETLKVVATVAGMGTVNAAATTQHLIDAYRPEAVVFSGIAGNLNRHLHINDVVLGGTLRYLDSDMRLIAQSAPKTEEFHSDPHLIELADEALDEMGITHITGIMMESFIEGGNQPAAPLPQLIYGKSITDKCIAWPETERLLRELARAVGERRWS